jgi:branched-subunit amino acid aminotransferase/4-amino-4-deoxychorismate lyase
MTQELAYLNGEFLAATELALSVDDLGFVQGVAISERMRTFRGKLFRLADHLQRLANSVAIIDLSLPYSLAEIGEVAEQLVAHNWALVSPEQDLGLSLFVTPGQAGSATPTMGMHTYSLPFDQWASYYTIGQALTETGIRQVPAGCWPRALKCRSRMHYYLADKLAHKLDPGSRAILLDLDETVSEASTANVFFYREEEGIVSPPLPRILPGVSLSVIHDLATELRIPMHYRDFRLPELAAADEILLCSTSPCVWPVMRLNGQPAGRGASGPLFRQLLTAWSELIGLDIQRQAETMARRR